MKFTLEAELPVHPPYRLDLTADALRRLAANVVDLISDDGIYRRAIESGDHVNVIEVRQRSNTALAVRIGGAAPREILPLVGRMLGTSVDLREWHSRAGRFAWLAALRDELRGLAPPRYPTLWEALAHAIVFQQISIHAAASIMRRLVEGLALPVMAAGVPVYPFPSAQRLLDAPPEMLKRAGLSANKIAHLRAAANALADGTIDESQLEQIPSEQAAGMLQRVRGIGPWSAAVVLLRGLGRLDVFPQNDSGVARSIRLLSGDPHIDAQAVLDALGPARGMLYFHLLLGRLRAR